MPPAMPPMADFGPDYPDFPAPWQCSNVQPNTGRPGGAALPEREP